MNARLYDPLVGRFLSPDPYVQDPGFSQNFNRYSYALNNPLKYTDESGELAWFIPVVAGAAIGAYTGASIQSGTAAFWEWDRNSWKGAISGAIIGGALGYFTGVTLDAMGIVAADGCISSSAGIFSSMLFDGTTRIAYDAITGGDWDSAWKSGLTGLVIGAWTGSGGFGLISSSQSDSKISKLARKLGYEIIGTSLSSIGNNFSSNRPLFSQVDLGIGPVTLSFGSGNLLQWRKNLPTLLANGVGLGNLLLGGKVSFDWENLSFNYTGGLIDKLSPIEPTGFGAYAVMGTSTMFDPVEQYQGGRNTYDHEIHHLWHSRALGYSFFPDYAFQGIASLLTGNHFLGPKNYFESLGYGYRWFKP